MGARAELLGIGRFQKDIDDCLNYPSMSYHETPPGTVVFSKLFMCNTSGQSADLARAIGASPARFETHKVTREHINWDQLRELADGLFAEEDPNQLERLLDAGFVFYYQPG